MDVRIHSRSVLLGALPFLFVAALTHSLSQAAFGQGHPLEESASFNHVKETVSRLLSEPVYTAGDERLLNEAGDSAALAITKTVSDQEMNSPESGRRILLILHLAFETPQSIIGRNNKTPNVALHLLEQLEQTEYGRQPNVIGNARFEIERLDSNKKVKKQKVLHLASLRNQKPFFLSPQLYRTCTELHPGLCPPRFPSGTDTNFDGYGVWTQPLVRQTLRMSSGAVIAEPF